MSEVSMGILVFNPDGTYRFDPAGYFDYLAIEEQTVATFTCRATDNDGLVSNTATNTITGVNQPPVAEDNDNITDANSVLTVNAIDGVLDNVDDVDYNDTHTVSAVNGDPAKVGEVQVGTNGGTFVINEDGSYTFNPNGHFKDLADGQTRATSITYTVSDNPGATDTATLTITVTGVAGSQSSATIASNPILAAAEESQDDSDDINSPHQGVNEAFGRWHEPVLLAAMAEPDPQLKMTRFVFLIRPHRFGKTLLLK